MHIIYLYVCFSDKLYSINTTEHFSRLIIEQVDGGDSGKYYVTVDNDVGSDSIDTTVTVLGTSYIYFNNLKFCRSSSKDTLVSEVWQGKIFIPLKHGFPLWSYKYG